MTRYLTKVTLLANGLPSGTLTLELSPDRTKVMQEFPPSSNWPFRNAASTFRLWIEDISYLNNFLYGYMSVLTPYNAIIMHQMPFCVYVGDEWPQAPTGIAHSLKPYEIDDNQFVLFSVLFEKAK